MPCQIITRPVLAAPTPADVPRHRAGQEQALGHPEQQPPRQQHAERKPGREEREVGDQVAAGCEGGERQAEQHRPPGPLRVAQIAGELAGQQGRDRLDADHPADGHRAEAEGVVNLHRQNRQRNADGEKTEEHHQGERQDAPGEVGRLGLCVIHATFNFRAIHMATLGPFHRLSGGNERRPL